jgi:hypothetical protein
MGTKKLAEPEDRSRRLLSLKNLRNGFGGGVVGMAVLAIAMWDRPDAWQGAAVICGLCLVSLVVVHRRILKLESQI